MSQGCSLLTIRSCNLSMSTSGSTSDSQRLAAGFHVVHVMSPSNVTTMSGHTTTESRPVEATSHWLYSAPSSSAGYSVELSLGPSITCKYGMWTGETIILSHNGIRTLPRPRQACEPPTPVFKPLGEGCVVDSCKPLHVASCCHGDIVAGLGSGHVTR